MGVGGTGVPGSSWLHLGFWSLLTAPWTWPKPQWLEPLSEAQPKAAVGAGPGACSQQYLKGPLLPKGAQLSPGLGFIETERLPPTPAGSCMGEVPSTWEA